MNWFTVLFTQPLANGLIIFYKLFGGNLGLAVIFFSLFLRFALTPLTRPYMENMKRMKEHAPELEKLKKKYKNDKQKLMQAQADFYKNKGINPGNGCLPYLIQIIILIALFRVFINVLTASDIVLKFNELLYGPLKLTAGTVISTKFLYLDLAKPDAFKLAVLPFSLPGPFLIASAVVQFLSAKLQMPQIEADKNVSKQTKGFCGSNAIVNDLYISANDTSYWS